MAMLGKFYIQLMSINQRCNDRTASWCEIQHGKMLSSIKLSQCCWFRWSFILLMVQKSGEHHLGIKPCKQWDKLQDFFHQKYIATSYVCHVLGYELHKSSYHLGKLWCFTNLNIYKIMGNPCLKLFHGRLLPLRSLSHAHSIWVFRRKLEFSWWLDCFGDWIGNCVSAKTITKTNHPEN